MDGQDPFNPPWINPPNDTPRSLNGSHSDTIQHHGRGALPAASTSPPYPPTTTSVPQGQFHSHAHSLGHHGSHQTPVDSPSLNPLHSVGMSRPGSDRRPSPSDHQRWVSGENGGSGGRPSHAPQNDFNLDLKPHRPPHHDPIPSTVPLDSSPQSNQYCRIPGCRNRAYYNFAEQEQTEYCGHGHELQAITTGLVNSCAMCKQRPRRTGERVCGRICRERDRQATQIQGSYYGVPVVRREPKARPGT